MDEDTAINVWVIIFMMCIVVGVVFEVVILGMAFFYADEIDCNLLWCEFKTTRSTHDVVSITSMTTTSSRTCLLNGEEINCTRVEHVMNGVIS